MNRDELLTKLAMELAEWPNTFVMIPPINAMPAGSSWERDPVGGWHARAAEGELTICHDDYLAERDRLINKPSWKDAPDEARWLAQDADGCWHWFTREDRDPVVGAAWAWVLPWCKDAFKMLASHGGVPAGHRWKGTLEQRPDSSISTSSGDIAVSEHEDEAFRECERRITDRDLADDLKCPSPSELVNRMLMERCDELQEANVKLAEENQRLRRTIGELCA